jgi:uncharacterized protein YdeI (YjbR/CyaY-like superfamily)
MAKHIDGIDLYYAKDTATWRKWLQKNSQHSRAVWLIYYKPASGKTRVSYNDAVDEALCFGWIDSKPNKLDEFRSIQFFAPRNPKSSWSKLNKERVGRLLKDGRMTAAGLKIIDAAKENGAWHALNNVEEMLIPTDLLKALKKNKTAHDYFTSFPKSSKKNILEWIQNAKQEITRSRRIAETVKLARENIRANHYRQPKGSTKKLTT